MLGHSLRRLSFKSQGSPCHPPRPPSLSVLADARVIQGLVQPGVGHLVLPLHARVVLVNKYICGSC